MLVLITARDGRQCHSPGSICLMFWHFSPLGGRWSRAEVTQSVSQSPSVLLYVSCPCRADAFARKRTVPPVCSLDATAPSPIPTVEPEFGVSSLVHPAFPGASTMTDLKAASGQVGIPLASASDVESLTPALLASQPLVYVPSSSLFMLYGSLQEGPSPGPGAEREGMTFKGSIGAQPVISAASSSLSSSTTSTQKRPREDRSPNEEEELASKRLSHDYEDRPLPLVVPKVRISGWM